MNLSAHPPTEEDIQPDEWDDLWSNFEADMKAADRADDSSSVSISW